MNDKTTPDPKTAEAEAADASADHGADREPTEAESSAAPDQVDESTAEAYEDMAEKGANVQGEGQIS